MRTNYLILILLGVFNFIFLKKSEFYTLSIYENKHLKESYNLTLLNIKESNIKNNPSKLALITDINYIDSLIYNYYSKYFNRIWIFYIYNLTQIKTVISKDFKNYDLSITGILIPKSLNYKKTKDNNKNKKVPVFEIDDELNETMIEYDIRKNNRNIYFTINISNDFIIPIQYIIIFSIFVLLSSIGLSLTWNIYEKSVGQNYIFNYHDKIKYIFCAHIFLALTLLFKTISIMRNENYELNATVEISLTLSCSLFKSILWFLIYLIGYGWQICFQDLILSEQRKLMRLLLIIVISFWMDQIIENYCDNLWIFHITEIKNLILYITLTYLIVKNIKKNINILNRKYNYALALLPDYAEGISEKIKLLSNLKIIVLIYIPLFIIILLIHKIFLYDYDKSILFIYDYLFPDFILEFLFILLMKPKIVSAFYNVDLGDMFNEIEGITYKCYLPKFDERLDNQKLEKNIKEKEIDINNIPIVIIGPCKEILNTSNSDNSGLLEHDVNKYFSNIQIGYYNK